LSRRLTSLRLHCSRQPTAGKVLLHSDDTKFLPSFSADDLHSYFFSGSDSDRTFLLLLQTLQSRMSAWRSPICRLLSASRRPSAASPRASSRRSPETAWNAGRSGTSPRLTAQERPRLFRSVLALPCCWQQV
jgi:hypothetical protein